MAEQQLIDAVRRLEEALADLYRCQDSMCRMCDCCANKVSVALADVREVCRERAAN
jgi:hypothetical protein